MKFSIVVPVYNVEKYLPECIESVLNQTYSNWELILIDDGSTDDSGNICDYYAEKDNRIIVVHSENKGGYQARLLANKYLTGDYVIGLDSDDAYEPFCLEKIKEVLGQNEVDMVIFGWNEFGKDISDKKRISPSYEAYKVISREELLLASIMQKDHLLWNKAVKKDIYVRAEYIQEEYKLGVAFDYIQVIPIICKTHSAYYLDEALYDYRVHDLSFSHTVKEQKIVDIDWVHCKIADFLEREGLLSDEVNLAMMKTYSTIVYPRLRTIIRDNCFLAFLRSKLNSLEYMKKVYENRDKISLKKKEAIIYKEAVKGKIFWGVVKAHFS